MQKAEALYVLARCRPATKYEKLSHVAGHGECVSIRPGTAHPPATQRGARACGAR